VAQSGALTSPVEQRKTAANMNTAMKIGAVNLELNNLRATRISLHAHRHSPTCGSRRTVAPAHSITTRRKAFTVRFYGRKV
jgi:hypothetical protein